MDFFLLGAILIWIILARIAEYYSKKERKTEWISDFLVIINYLWLFGLIIYIIKIILFVFLSWLPFILIFAYLSWLLFLKTPSYFRAKGEENTAAGLEMLGALFLVWIIVYLPIYAVSVYFDISIKTMLPHLLILLSWFPLLIIITSFGQRLYNLKRTESIAGFLLLIAIVDGIYILIKYVFEHPETNPIFALITIVLMFTIILLAIVYRYVFPTPEIEINLKNLHTEVGKIIKTRWDILILPFFITILFLLLWFQLRFEIKEEFLYWLYATASQVFGALLGIVVVLSIFVLQQEKHQDVITEKFIKSIKGMAILYGSVILNSFIGLILTQAKQTLNIHKIYTFIDSFSIASLLVVILLIFTSITLTIYFLFEIVSVLVPPDETLKVGFDETRLYERYDNNDLEGRILASGFYGCSEFASSLTGFRVSRISKIPITYETLERYSVLIILRSYKDYSLDEIDAIEKFVKTGGGLFLTCNFWDGNVDFSANSIAKRFGVSFANNGKIYHLTNYYEDTKKTAKISDIKTHEITRGVSCFCLHNGTYILDIGSSNVLAYTDNDSWFDKFGENDLGNEKKDDDDITGRFPVLSEIIYGKGKVVFISSNFNFTNEFFNKDDDKQLAVNIVNWLAGRTESLSQIADG